MIQAMTSPFRYNKKQRKRYRRRAKAEMKVAGKFANAEKNPKAVADLQWLADLNTKIAKKRKGKSKNSD
jgi:hypothetical protein